MPWRLTYPVKYVKYMSEFVGPLAQLAEHRPFKAGAVGSSPTRLICMARSSIG